MSVRRAGHVLRATPVAQRANRPMAAGSIVGPQSPLWDTPASLVSGDSPVYPINEFLTGGEGHAEVEFTVTREGATRDITALWARRPAFGKHLAAAVRGWRFEPARMDGLALPSTLRVEFDYSIDQGLRRAAFAEGQGIPARAREPALSAAPARRRRRFRGDFLRGGTVAAPGAR